MCLHIYWLWSSQQHHKPAKPDWDDSWIAIPYHGPTNAIMILMGHHFFKCFQWFGETMGFKSEEYFINCTLSEQYLQQRTAQQPGSTSPKHCLHNAFVIWFSGHIPRDSLEQLSIDHNKLESSKQRKWHNDAQRTAWCANNCPTCRSVNWHWNASAGVLKAKCIQVGLHSLPGMQRNSAKSLLHNTFWINNGSNGLLA